MARKPKRLFRPRRTDSIVSHIKNLVYRGTVKPGERLPSERDLALVLNVGRPTVREALQQLEALGLVENTPGGRIVRNLVPQSPEFPLRRTLEDERQVLLQIVDVRMALEGWVAAEAAARATPEDLARIHDIVEHVKTAAAAGQPLAALDLEFHRAIVEATHNPVATQMLEILTAMIGSVTAFKQLAAGGPRRVDLDLHQTIVTALEKGDPASAQNAMVSHLKAVRQTLLSVELPPVMPNTANTP
jgi:GntR family transcriptional repressor for pyruvate dehydrogenase complex